MPALPDPARMVAAVTALHSSADDDLLHGAVDGTYHYADDFAAGGLAASS